MEIIIDHATKRIRNATVLKDISYRFTSGRVYGLQGPNGCGKTMLMRLVAGLIRPTEGSVYVDGAELGKEIDFPDSMGVLIENPAFLPNSTGMDNLKLLVQLKNRISDRQIKQAIENVGLDPQDCRKYKKYSLGMKQRLGIAAALMEQPELIILDEPTNALDNNGIEQICALIRREQKRGALILLTCHDSAILTTLSDEIISIDGGSIERRHL